MKSVFFLAALILVPLSSWALSSKVTVDSMEVHPANSTYTGLYQTTRELRKLKDETIFIDYTLNGQKRRLHDDDGLATLYLYHRTIADEVFDQKLRLTAMLPRPKEPLIIAIGNLKKTYTNILAKNQSLSEQEKMKIEALKDRIQTLGEVVASEKFSLVKDLKSSGMEDLINELEAVHTYFVEKGPTDKDNTRGRLSDLIGVGLPATLNANTASRSRDEMDFDVWDLRGGQGAPCAWLS